MGKLTVKQFKEAFSKQLEISNREQLLEESLDSLNQRFPDLDKAQKKRLVKLRDILVEAARIICNQQFPGVLAEPVAEAKAMNEALAKKDQVDIKPLSDAGYRAELAYDLAEMLMNDHFDHTPLAQMGDLILSNEEKTQEWCDSFLNYVKSEQRVIRSVTHQLVDKRFLDALRKKTAKAATEKLAGLATAGLGKTDGEELTRRLEELLVSSPKLAAHFATTFSGSNGANVYFSGKAKDAFYTNKGDRSRNIPDNVIILPSKGKTPIDLLDGLLFETCNAEIQSKYDNLTKEYLTKLRGGQPLEIADFGETKARIEAEAVLKDAQLLMEARDCNVETAYQGNRNLLAMLRTAREMKGEKIEDYDKIIEDPEDLSNYLDEHAGELRQFLRSADSDPTVYNAVLDAMANSPHNRNATKPEDKNGLSSKDLYAYELLETAPGQVQSMLEHEIEKAMKPVPGNVKNFLKNRITGYDGSDKLGRQSAILCIIDDLKEVFPEELAGVDFATLGFTKAMRDKAEARLKAFKQGKSAEFGKLQKRQVELALGELNSSLNLKFVNSMTDDLGKDAGAVVKVLQNLVSVNGIPQQITKITDNVDSNKLSSKVAGEVTQDVTQSVVAVIQPYNECAMTFLDDMQYQTLSTNIGTLRGALRNMPRLIASETPVPLAMLARTVEDIRRF